MLFFLNKNTVTSAEKFFFSGQTHGKEKKQKNRSMGHVKFQGY